MADQDGRFLLEGVPSGAYELIAVGPAAGYSTFGPSAGPNPRRGQMRIEVAGVDVRDLQIALREPFAVEGKAVYDRPADAAMACHADAEIRLVPADSGPRSGSPAVRISREGAFILEGVWPGNYGVALNDFKGACSVKEIRAGDSSARDGVLSLTGAAGERITITLSAKTGKMDGAVKTEDNQPCPGAVVLLTPAGASGAWAGETLIAFAGEEGRYAFDRIPPGRYRAMAMRRVVSNEYLDPSFWSERRSFSFEFEVEPGSVTTADIRVAR